MLIFFLVFLVLNHLFSAFKPKFLKKFDFLLLKILGSCLATPKYHKMLQHEHSNQLFLHQIDNHNTKL